MLKVADAYNEGIMENQNAELPNNQPTLNQKTSINSTAYLCAMAAIISIFILGTLSGSPQIAKAINITLVVATLALGMKFGFAWVTVATERDPSSPTVIATRPDAMQAAPLVSLLEANGIQAVATGTHTSGFQVEIASVVNVVVPKRDAAHALEILNRELDG